MIIPTILERSSNGQTAYDLYSRLLEDRIIYLNWAVTDEMSNLVIAELLYLAKKDPDKDITMYVNSPGGSVTAWLAIYDTMQFIPCEIQTVCVGLAASMWSIILTWWTKWKRYALPNSEVLIHQPLIQWWAWGQATEIAILAQNMLKSRDKLNWILSKHTWQTFEKIEKDTDRDNWLDAKQALEYWLIDKILDYKVKNIDI